MGTYDCQLVALPKVEGRFDDMPMTPMRRLKTTVTRPLSPPLRGAVNRYSRRVATMFHRRTGRSQASRTPSASAVPVKLQAGDVVRVRPREEIEATLDHRGRLKGCGFMVDMWQYCGTTQRVLKPMERFLDECDYRVKSSKGLVLLEGLMCQGTPNIGRCDRSCFYFWRVEWLERVDEPDAQSVSG